MIEFRTKLDSSKTKALQKYGIKRAWWALVLFSVIMIGVGVLALVLLDGGMFGLFFIIFGVVFTPIVFISARSSQKNLDKTFTLLGNETVQIFTFDENYITITQNKGEEYSAYTKAKYSYIYEAREDKDFYYLYISKLQCHVIDKASITQGSLEEMNELLRVRLGGKFKTNRK